MSLYIHVVDVSHKTRISLSAVAHAWKAFIFFLIVIFLSLFVYKYAGNSSMRIGSYTNNFFTLSFISCAHTHTHPYIDLRPWENIVLFYLFSIDKSKIQNEQDRRCFLFLLFHTHIDTYIYMSEINKLFIHWLSLTRTNSALKVYAICISFLCVSKKWKEKLLCVLMSSLFVFLSCLYLHIFYSNRKFSFSVYLSLSLS